MNSKENPPLQGWDEFVKLWMFIETTAIIKISEIYF